MPLHYSLLALFLLLGALGYGYVAGVGYDFSPDQPPIDQALDDTPDEPAQDRTDGDQTPRLSGSSDRRMDDFGAGPGGKVVTVPLKERHRQAFAGSTAGGGGIGSQSPDRPTRSTDENALKSVEQDTGSLETAAVSPLQPAIDAADRGTELTQDVAPQGRPEPATLASPTEQQVAVTERADTADNPVAEQQEDTAASSYRVIERESEPSAETTDEADVITPSFDIVRVDPLGNTVLAGRAAPFAEVDIKVGDEVVDSVTATELGEWVSTPIKPLAGGDQEISLSASSENAPAIPSKQVVVVSLPEPAEPRPAETDEPVAVLLDREKGGEGRILQAPGRLQGEGQLALKLVDYDDEGAIKLSGEAPPGVPVRIYIDNKPAALVIGDAKGYWITTLDRDLPGGDYTLRLDQLDRKGETVARLETPLTRVTTPPIEGEAKVDYVVVQPGNSLWRIARRLSGDGFNYVYIYEANQAQIRDPDVIYPGQVFEVPAQPG